MATQKALLLLEKHGEFALRDIPVPAPPGPGELLIEVKATALNPVDWKIVNGGFDFLAAGYPVVLGHDSAGIVKELGADVTEFAVGDKVLHQGAFNNRNGTFQQYTIVPAEIAAKLPSSLTFEQGSTIPAVLATAAPGMYSGKISTGEIRGAGLTPPWVEGGRGKYAGIPLVIIGGSSSVGQQVIQLAKLSGFNPIITVASLKNADLVKSLGATHVIDRNAPLAPSVKAITSEPIKYIYDAISLKGTQEASYDLLAPGGTLVLVLPFVVDAAKVDNSKTVAQVAGTAHDPTQRELFVGLYKNLTKLLEDGDIKPNAVEVLPGGLAAIPDGLERLRADQVSAKKLVAQPWA